MKGNITLAKKQIPAVKTAAKKTVAKTTAKPVVKTAAKQAAAPVKKTVVKRSSSSTSKLARKISEKHSRLNVQPVAEVKPILKEEPEIIAKLQKFKPNRKTRYTAKELDQFKKIIVSERNKILEIARANMQTLVDDESGYSVGDDKSYSSHSADQGTDEIEREKNYMFLQRDEKYLGYLQEALTRIENGTYGVCMDCINDPKNLCRTCPLIDPERLELVPVTQHCIECKNLRG